MRLPPPGSAPSEIVSYIDALVWESASDFRRVKVVLEWDRALQLMFGEHWPSNRSADENNRLQLTLNRIVRCVMSMMVLQAGDPPLIKRVPRETGEPSLYFLRQPPRVDPASGKAIPAPSQQIDEGTAMALKAQRMQMQAGATMAAQQGMGAPPPDPLVEVNDQTCCEALQTVADGMDEEIGFNFIFRENVYYKLQFGSQPARYGFNPNTKQHEIDNRPPTHVFYQRSTADMLRNPYCVDDEYVSSDDALALAAMALPKAEFEKMRAAIESYWTEAKPQIPGSQPYQPSAIFNQIFKRSGGYVRRAWIRNQPYPMTLAEALEDGKVEVCEYQLNPQAMAGAGNAGEGSGPSSPQSSTSVPAGSPQAPQNASVGPSSTLSATNPQANGPADSQYDAAVEATAQSETAQPPDLTEYMVDVPPPPPMRQGYCLAGTTTEVTPPDAKGNTTHPLWPMTLAFRQIIIIGRELIKDERSPFPICPVINNVNIGIPFSPLGMGEPKILEDLQRALNFVFSSIITWAQHNSVPPEFVLNKIISRLQDPWQKARTKWGQRIPFFAEDLPAGWKLPDAVVSIPPPPMPAEFWKILDFLTSMIDKEGNQADVAQGNAAPGWSGEAINALQNAHNQLVRASGLGTEDWLRQLTILKDHSIAHHMTAQDCFKRCRKYPIEVWQVLHQRFKNLRPIYSVEIGSASGASKASQTQQLIAARQVGIGGMGLDTKILEGLGVDPDEVQQNNVEQAQNAPAQPKRPSNGQGRIQEYGQ